MQFPAFAQFLWLPWAMVAAILMIALLIALAIRARRRLWRILLGLSAALVLISSCAGIGVASLNARRAYEPPANAPAPVPDSLSLVFMQEVPATTSLYPTQTIVALNARTGSIRWRHPTDSPQGQLTHDEHTVYFATGQDVLALRGSDGEQLWRTPLSAPPGASSQQSMQLNLPPVVSDGIVFVFLSPVESLSGNGAIFAFRADTGVQIWSVLLSGIEDDLRVRQMSVGEGMVFVNSPEGYISAFRGDDGATVWRQSLSPSMNALDPPRTLAFGDSELFLANQHSMLALHARDGSLAWSRQLPGKWVNSPISVGVSSIYYQTFEIGSSGGERDYLNSRSAQTGDLQWRYADRNASGAVVVEAGGLVYFASDRYLDALRESDGRHVWRHSSNINVGFGDMAIANNVLFVRSAIVYPHIITSCPPDCEPPEAVNALNATTGAVYWRSAVSGWNATQVVD